MRKTFFQSIFIFSIFLSSLFAQQSNFITYTAKDGLPVSTILSIVQDSRNYLWIGTEGGGICRFDGSDFINYTTKNGLISNRVQTIMEDSHGNLWIGTDKGISTDPAYWKRTWLS